MHGYAFLGKITELERLKNNVNINSNFWDTHFDSDCDYTGMYTLASIFALSNKQYETLKWLESNSAKKHIELFKTENKVE